MRRLVEVEPVLLEDEPALGHFIRRELEEHGRLEVWLGASVEGAVAGVTKTILEPGDPIDDRELEEVLAEGISYAEAMRRAYELVERLGRERGITHDREADE